MKMDQNFVIHKEIKCNKQENRSINIFYKVEFTILIPTFNYLWDSAL